MPSRSSFLSRLLSVVLVGGGLFTGVLGASGAPAQEPTPQATATEAPAVAALTTTVAPTTTAVATPAAAAGSPPATPSTPIPAAPSAAATPDMTATPDASRERKRERAPKRAKDETCLETPDGIVAGGEAGLAGSSTDSPKPSSTLPAEPSTSGEACDATGDKKKTKKKKKRAAKRSSPRESSSTAPSPTVRADGSPAPANPGYALATPGPARVGVPNFFIEKFRIPPFLLPIYQAAGTQYGIRWELLAAINEIETDYGRNLNVSSAGAQGWMQFMPASWRAYGVDANKDGVKDPYNPVDAIFAAARYLRAAGGENDVRKAVFAYNHADWYVDSVLMRARLIGGLPSGLVSSLTGLTQGRFPVAAAKATYADDLSERPTRRAKRGQNAAYLVESSASRRGIRIYARRGAPVVAVNDGRVRRIGETERLGRYVQLQDVYGNTYTYARLKKVATRYPAPKPVRSSPAQIRRELELPKDPAPTAPASKGTERRQAAPAQKQRIAARRPAATAVKERLFANPDRRNALQAGGDQQLVASDVILKDLKVGSKVAAGTVLGRIGTSADLEIAPHALFEVRPAGRGAPRIDPKPILDGWKLLESTAIYRAKGKNPFFGRDAVNPSIGQILLMSKEALARRVVANPRIDLYGCGRRDVELGQIDRRVLATLEFLAASGLKPTVTSLKCGHGYLTASGNVSHHSSGNAVDIAAINGIPILGNQGRGSVTELAIQRLLTLQGTMEPDQIISLMTFSDRRNTFAMGDHADHIHVGWQPQYGSSRALARRVDAALKPKQWIKLIDRLARIDNPTVRTKPSKASIEVARRDARSGD